MFITFINKYKIINFSFIKFSLYIKKQATLEIACFIKNTYC